MARSIEHELPRLKVDLNRRTGQMIHDISDIDSECSFILEEVIREPNSFQEFAKWDKDHIVAEEIARAQSISMTQEHQKNQNQPKDRSMLAETQAETQAGTARGARRSITPNGVPPKKWGDAN